MPSEAVELRTWESFYVIVGTSAAALTGLQFVVMALVADVMHEGTRSDIDAFGTPTILHFSAVLLVSAIVSAPWPALGSAAIAPAVCGTGGIVYMTVVLRRARRCSSSAVRRCCCCSSASTTRGTR